MYDSNEKYLFNDEFAPKSYMKSALWFQMMNTKASDNCGSYENPHPDFTGGHTRTLHSPDNKALYFSGFDNRYAETIDLNMLHGGKVVRLRAAFQKFTKIKILIKVYRSKMKA